MRETRFHSAQWWPSVSVLILGLLIYGFAQGSGSIIGEGVVRVKDKDYPALCRVEVEPQSDSEEGFSCSGTLVGSNEIATGAHCFGKSFELGYRRVNVSCGGRSARVSSVLLPAENLWLDETRPSIQYDYAKVKIRDPLSGAIPKATGPGLYFEGTGLKSKVRCWMAGFGNSKRSNYGALNLVEVTGQSFAVGNGMIIMRDPKGGVLKMSADHGDSGGALYCQAPGGVTELVGVIVGYRAERNRDRNRMENEFATIWTQPNY